MVFSESKFDIQKTYWWEVSDHYAKGEFPEEWRRSYPRIYRNTETWPSPRLPAAVICDNLCTFTLGKEVPNSAQTQALICLKLLSMNVPTYFIAPDLFASAARTNPPAEYKWMDIRLPLDSALLMLPKGALNHPTDGPIDFIAYAKIGITEQLRAPRQMRSYRTPDDCFLLFTSLTGIPGCQTLSHGQDASKNPFVTRSAFDFEAQAGRTLDPLEVPISTTDNDFLQEMMRITCMLLSVMSIRPELVEKGERQKGTHKSGAQLWTPNVVGRKYRVQREAPLGGTHASPRWHWRRGHIRMQRFGPGLAEVKERWIEATQVNVPETEEGEK